MDEPTANSNEQEDTLVNETPPEPIPEDASKEVRAALSRQAKIIVALRKQHSALKLEMKEKLKERKEDQIKMLLFRDFLSAHAGQGLFTPEMLMTPKSANPPVNNDPNLIIQQRIDHCIGLAEVAFQRLKGRIS